MRTPTWLALVVLVGCSSSAEMGATSGGTSGSSTGGATGGASAGTTGGTSGGSSGGSSGATTGAATTGGDTWTNWASADFFQAYCTSCHSAGGEGDPGGSGFDWTQYSDVQTDANLIRCGVAVTQDPSWHCPGSIVAEQFPIGTGPHPSEAERNRLVNWIDAGAPEN